MTDRWGADDKTMPVVRETLVVPDVALPPIPPGFRREVECRPDGTTVAIDVEVVSMADVRRTRGQHEAG